MSQPWYLKMPWHGRAVSDLDNCDLAMLLTLIAQDAESAIDRKISAVGLADILLSAAERIERENCDEV
jgi:hypothetical protein|tara:strand:- start:777 stop:980 length:204 start_codon:yes stop_codon:yes gene_type:complete